MRKKIDIIAEVKKNQKVKKTTYHIRLHSDSCDDHEPLVV